METPKLNYTNVCWYCGVIYKSNRRTSKYCCKQHNSLYALYGPMVKSIVMVDGTMQNYDFFLRSIYNYAELENPDDWGMGYLKKTIQEDFEYQGPLPKGEEILVVGKYVIKRHAKGITTDQEVFFVKPFWLLTDTERMSSVIIAANHDTK